MNCPTTFQTPEAAPQVSPSVARIRRRLRRSETTSGAPLTASGVMNASTGAPQELGLMQGWWSGGRPSTETTWSREFFPLRLLLAFYLSCLCTLMSVTDAETGNSFSYFHSSFHSSTPHLATLALIEIAALAQSRRCLGFEP
jgi:hypothetical protein